ncbi:MAG: type II toxin-antitoxin system VapC family toxin [Chloroflexi bacterium]|nr:type II toxin-antitoxin system VapC family toxin [Chloroflexota bacterium]
MNIVVDASLTGALFVRMPWSAFVERQFRTWRLNGDQMFVPSVWLAEVTSILRKAATSGRIKEEDARVILTMLPNLHIQIISPNPALLDAAFIMAGRLGITDVYAVQYLALAEHLHAEFWTVNHKLYETLKEFHFDWIKFFPTSNTATESRSGIEYDKI